MQVKYIMTLHFQKLHEQLTLTGSVIGSHSLENINQLASREAMALPEFSLRSALDDLSSTYATLSNLSKQTLLELTNKTTAIFKQRYVAGQLLGLLGDPRIDTLNPPMIIIKGAKATIGLDLDKLDSVVEAYQHYGIQQSWIKKETPCYEASLDTFSLAKYCVTNQEYLQFLHESQYDKFPENWQFGIYPNYKANHPVYTVGIEDANAYIDWINERTGRNFRLPKEAEWEYAAAGMTSYDFPWGDVYLKDHCNTIESGILQSTPIGIFPLGAAPFGHMDMAGNVEEYVADPYHSYPKSSLVHDDLWNNNKSYTVARGGSFTRFRDLARTRRRHGKYDSELYIMGFRLAEELKG